MKIENGPTPKILI